MYYIGAAYIVPTAGTMSGEEWASVAAWRRANRVDIFLSRTVTEPRREISEA